MVVQILQGIASFFGAATKVASEGGRMALQGGKAILEGVTPMAKNALTKLTQTTMPLLKKGFVFAKNVSTQALDVIKSKAQSASNLLKLGKTYWASAIERRKEINEELRTRSNKAVKNEMETTNELILLQEETKLLEREEKCYKHLEKDAKDLESKLKEEREHDLVPLIAKGSHASQLILADSQQNGAVDPAILEEFEETEEKIISEVERIEDFDRKVEKDEFKVILELISLLTKENELLKKEIEMEKSKKDTQEIERAQKRAAEIKAEVSLLENTLAISKQDFKVDDDLIRKIRELHDVLQFIKNFEKKEEEILEEDVKERRVLSSFKVDFAKELEFLEKLSNIKFQRNIEEILNGLNSVKRSLLSQLIDLKGRINIEIRKLNSPEELVKIYNEYNHFIEKFILDLEGYINEYQNFTNHKIQNDEFDKIRNYLQKASNYINSSQNRVNNILANLSHL